MYVARFRLNCDLYVGNKNVYHPLDSQPNRSLFIAACLIKFLSKYQGCHEKMILDPRIFLLPCQLQLLQWQSIISSIVASLKMSW